MTSADLVLVADALVRATPLILTGLAVAFAFKGGVFNIGAEGQLVVGAAASAALSLTLSKQLGPLILPVALLAGALAGATWAAVAAELRRRFQVLEIISTIMLNFIAIHLVSYLVRGPLQEPTRIFPQTHTLETVSHLPVLIPGTRLHVGFVVAICLAVFLSWFFAKTVAGFHIRATGASPQAAATSGRIDVGKTSFLVFLASGAIAGLAGGIEVTGVTFALYENLSPGYGYTGIAVALIAGLNPGLIIASGIFFGALQTGALALQREFAIPSSLASVAEAVLILGVLSIAAYRGRAVIGLSRRAVP